MCCDRTHRCPSKGKGRARRTLKAKEMIFWPTSEEKSAVVNAGWRELNGPNHRTYVGSLFSAGHASAHVCVCMYVLCTPDDRRAAAVASNGSFDRTQKASGRGVAEDGILSNPSSRERIRPDR